MESNKVAILEKRLPLRNYPEKEVDNLLSTVFKFWLAKLLSIKSDNEDKLDNALPAIKKHFWSLGINEVKKAFEMYSDGELSIKPVPNYFDRILVGQIFKEYKAQKQKPVKRYDNYISQEEKDFIMMEAVDRIEKDFKQNGKITETCFHVYAFLFEQGKLSKDLDYNNKKFKEAVIIHSNTPIEDETEYQKIISNFERKEKNEVKNIARRLVLEDYYGSGSK